MCFLPLYSFPFPLSVSLCPSLQSLCHLCIPIQTSLNSLFSKGSSGFGCLAWPCWPLIGDAGTTSLWGQKHLSLLTAVKQYMNPTFLAKSMYIVQIYHSCGGPLKADWPYNVQFLYLASFFLIRLVI